jgi:hypothetical protein
MSVPFLGLCVSFLQAVFEVAIVEEIHLDAPVIKLIRCFYQHKEVGGWSGEYTLQPSWEWLHRLGGSAGLSIDLDEVRATARAIVYSEYGEHTLVEHFDPFGGVMEPIADGHCEIWILGIFNIPLWTVLEVFFIGLDTGLKAGNFFFKVSLLIDMALLPNSDSTDQRGGNLLEYDCIDVSIHGKGYGDGARGLQSFERWVFLDLGLGEREWVRGDGV